MQQLGFMHMDFLTILLLSLSITDRFTPSNRCPLVDHRCLGLCQEQGGQTNLPMISTIHPILFLVSPSLLS